MLCIIRRKVPKSATVMSMSFVETVVRLPVQPPLKSCDGCVMIGHGLVECLNLVAMCHQVLTCFVVD
jgi:hypothetical protein